MLSATRSDVSKLPGYATKPADVMAEFKVLWEVTKLCGVA